MKTLFEEQPCSSAITGAESMIMDTIIEPNACAVCNRPKTNHGMYFGKGHHNGNYFYVEPTDAVRLERMKYRRKLRGEK